MRIMKTDDCNCNCICGASIVALTGIFCICLMCRKGERTSAENAEERVLNEAAKNNRHFYSYKETNQSLIYI